MDGAAGLLEHLAAGHAAEECRGVIEHAPIQGLKMGANIVKGTQLWVRLAIGIHAKVSKPGYIIVQKSRMSLSHAIAISFYLELKYLATGEP